MTVIAFPEPEKPEPLLVGPFQSWRVVVDGRAIPRLTGCPQDDGRVSLIVDGRFLVDFPDEATARGAAWLIAQALAVGEGYTHLGALNKDQPFAPTCGEFPGEQK